MQNRDAGHGETETADLIWRRVLKRTQTTN